MKNIKVKKTDLIKVLKKNREKHKETFNLAIHGYKITLHKQMLEKLDQLSKNEEVDHIFKLDKPQSHLNDYDIIIGMLSITEDELIELSENDYKGYYLDEWNWKNVFIGSNSGYIGIGTDSPTYSFIS